MAVERIGVVGAGVMGSEIAFVAARAGCMVTLCDADAAALERGVAHVQRLAERAVTRGRMDDESAHASIARVAGSQQLGDLAGCDLVIEAVSEVLAVKQNVFGAIDRVLAPAGLIASNTSGLSISTLAAATSRPAQVLGLHFFNPASVMRLVEVVEGAQTSPQTLSVGEQFARELGKTPVRVSECPGFLVNRVLVRAMVESYRHTADAGADPASVDAAIVAAGPAPMGPFALGDLIGLDTMEHLRGDLVVAYGDRFGDRGTLAAKVAAGMLGNKTGGGFFAGSADVPLDDDDAARAAAERYYVSAIDEARRCLAEQVAGAADIDIALCLGAGWSEGPLAMAARIANEEMAP